MTVEASTAAGSASLVSNLTATSTSAGASVDGQSGDGLLVIGTSALSGATGVLVTFTLQKPSFSISGKVATLLGTPLAATPAANGTAALAELRDSGGNTVFSQLTVGTSAADVIVSSTGLLTSVTCSLVSGTLTVP